MTRPALVILLLLTVGCGSAIESPPTTTLAAETSVTSPPEPATTAATTTSVAATTTTIDVGEAVAAAFADRGYVPVIPNNTPTGFGDQLCSRVAEIDPASGIYFENLALSIHRSAPPRIWETTAVLVETVCPEHASALEFTSEEYAAAREVGFEVGDCVAMPAYGLLDRPMFPVECNEPHDGEIVGFIDAGDRSFPTDQQSGLDLVRSVNCGTEVMRYVGGFGSIGVFARMVADSQEEWDAGETRVLCLAAAGGPVLVGSLRDAGTAMDAVRDSVEVAVAVCELERFEATVTNRGTTNVGVWAGFVRYFPTGVTFEFFVPQIGPGESVDISRQFINPDPASLLECEPSVNVFPIPLG